MEWIEPKTDWEVAFDLQGNYIGDYFNIEDYYRIKNNIEYIHTYTLMFFRSYDILSMRELKITDYENIDNALTIIEKNIEIISKNTFNFEIEIKEWLAGGITPHANDFNRIESFLLEIKNELDNTQPSRRLLEDGSYRLLEDGNYRLLEYGKEMG